MMVISLFYFQQLRQSVMTTKSTKNVVLPVKSPVTTTTIRIISVLCSASMVVFVKRD